MPETPQSDMDRIPSANPDQTWPEKVEIRMHWERADGSHATTSTVITKDEFFGLGGVGAPMNGEALIATIERQRRQGAPPVKETPARMGHERKKR